MHLLIFVHGMGHGPTNKALDQLWQNLERDYREMRPGVDLDFHAHFRRINIQWDEVIVQGEKILSSTCNWVKETKDESQPLMELLFKSFWPRLNDFGFYYIGDIIAYASDNDNDIRGAFWRQLKTALDEHPGCSFSLLGHSLGGNICFDFAYALHEGRIFRNGAGDLGVDPADVAARFKAMYTFGAPLTYFLMRKSELWKDGNNFRNVINPMGSKVWLNFRDSEDPIAMPFSPILKLNPQRGHERFQEVQVQCGSRPDTSHIGYWSCGEMARRIAATLPDVVMK